MQATSRAGGRAVVASAVVGIVVVFFFVWLFAAALHQPTPHDLPVGFVGPAVAEQLVVAGAEAKSPGVFSFTTYASEDEARQAIRHRDITGALVLGSAQPLILVASAAGQSASSAISGAFSAMLAASGRFDQPAAVEDVQPLPSSDSRGLVPFFLALGVSISAFIFSLLARAQLARLPIAGKIGGLVLFAVIDGLVASLAVSIVVGFNATYWSLAGVCALFALAVAAGTTACFALFGRVGVPVAGLVLILLANASSGSVVGSAFLSQPFRWLSPGLPAGPALESVRSVLYFEGAGAAWRLGTLAIWVGASLVIIAVMHAWRAQRTQPSAAMGGA